MCRIFFCFELIFKMINRKLWSQLKYIYFFQFTFESSDKSSINNLLKYIETDLFLEDKVIIMSMWWKFSFEWKNDFFHIFFSLKFFYFPCKWSYDFYVEYLWSYSVELNFFLMKMDTICVIIVLFHKIGCLTLVLAAAKWNIIYLKISLNVNDDMAYLEWCHVHKCVASWATTEWIEPSNSAISNSAFPTCIDC